MIAEPFLKWRERVGREKGRKEGREEVLSHLDPQTRQKVERELLKKEEP